MEYTVLRKISWEETEKGKPFTREQLAQWGVDFPPLQGWRTALAKGTDPNVPYVRPAKSSKAVTCVQ
jgi:hypothetical protein